MSLLKQTTAGSTIQSKWRKYLSFRDNIQYELKFFRDILFTIMKKINNNDIITSKNYKRALKTIHYINDTISKYPNVFNIRVLYKISKFRLYLDMAKIKLGLIELTQSIGLIDIYQSINLFLDKKELPELYDSHISYYNKFFNITRIESYISKNNNNISFVLNTYGKDVKKHSVTLTTYQINKPSINKYSSTIKNINIQILGAKIYIPYGNKLLILFGYFINDHLNSYSKLDIFIEKYTELENLITNLDINLEFKKTYLKTLSINEFTINSPSQICNNCIGHYNDNLKLKNWNVSKIVKTFILSEDLYRYNIIKNLAMDISDNNSGYIANLLIDLIGSNDDVLKINNIIDIFHWDIRHILDITQYKIDKEKTKNISEEIPYEKKIHLMKTTDLVKTKARDKLRDINSGKPGESNNKATQYLEGLLKIPFGIYKRTIIKRKLNDLLINVSKYKNMIRDELCLLEENNILNDTDLKSTEELFNILKKFNTIDKPFIINNFIKALTACVLKLNNNICLNQFYKVHELKKFILKNFKIVDLKNILVNLNIDHQLKLKSDLVSLVINSSVKYNKIKYFFSKIKLKQLFSIVPLSNECEKIRNHLNSIKNEYNNYIKVQNKYFEDIDNSLNESIYGLDTAKIQIKRMLAQWINGNNDGYIFGLEGPPGTGKTTLAKKGIANCLKDEHGNKRPFIFIPLGGSSNGSTLEGHNYTYVGSTWGRIVDGIIESKCMNPIIYIDELDKISKTEHGKEIIGILTHMTDKSQNSAFMDKYFSGIKIDLSKCLIIFSYNDPGLIDRILLDRIHRIEIKPLNMKSKVIVSNKHLIPEILTNIGYSENEIHISDSEIEYIITKYTYEAGARKLKEKLYEIYRDINLRSLENDNIIPFTITKKYIDEVFSEYQTNEILKIHTEPRIGTINGLFATTAGLGGITIIESKKFATNTHLELKLTGMQGDVMKESMEVAKTLAMSIIPVEILKKIMDGSKFGIHIHCPAGATKKDGPSAGTAITLAIISLLCDIPIKNDIGITGEINLNGEIMPIGGLSSKVHGGKMAGVKRILCPSKNKQDLDKILKEHPELTNKNFSIECKSNIFEAMLETMIFKNKKHQNQFIHL
tara:strand:- start:2772 stop:6092 length:3321 start_codon:yes stop_codon:yes gene_type:complete